MDSNERVLWVVKPRGATEGQAMGCRCVEAPDPLGACEGFRKALSPPLRAFKLSFATKTTTVLAINNMVDHTEM